MGALAGKAAADRAMTLDRIAGFGNEVQHERDRLDTMFRDQGLPPGILIQELKETMWFNAGIVRDRQSLDRAMEIIMAQEEVPGLVATPRDLIRVLEFRNMRLVAELTCRSALERKESRGSHFRSDYPEENNQWLKNIQVKKTDSGVMLTQVPVSGRDSILS
jgi:fumarate reductase (CoM/CoB) subunit A